MSAAPTAGRSLRCENCGSAFSVAALGATATCPSCGHAQSTAEVASELKAYGRDVGERLASADEAYADAARWANVGGGRDTSQVLKMAMGLMAGVPIVLVIVGLVLSRIEAVQRLMPFIAIVGAYGGVVVFFVWYLATGKRVRARRAAAGETPVACPNCGAPGVLTAGGGVDLCDHCGATLVPSRATIGAGLDAARQAWRRARIERLRSERDSRAKMAAATHSAFGRIMPYIGFGFMALMFGGTILVYAFLMAIGREPYDPAIFVAVPIVLGLGVPGALYLQRLWERSRSWRQAVGDLARQFQGRVHDRLDDWVAWLNRYWPAEFEVTLGRTYGPAAILDVGGYPALVLADQEVPMQNYKPQIQILLAAWVPGRSDEESRAVSPDEAGRAARKRLMDAGFQITIDEAGVQARAGKAVYKRLLDHPGSAHRLAPVLGDLKVLAESIGAEPAVPIDG